MNWIFEINFKQHLNEDESPEAVVKATAAIVGELKAFIANPTSRDSVMALLMTDVREMIAQLDDVILDSESLDGDVDEFNTWLDSIYDWADCWRVWIGKRREQAVSA